MIDTFSFPPLCWEPHDTRGGILTAYVNTELSVADKMMKKSVKKISVIRLKWLIIFYIHAAQSPVICTI